MTTFLKYQDFIDPKRKGKFESITIFDVDDTLIVTDSKIRVTDTETGKSFELTPAEFNEFERHPKHDMDFSDFTNLDILKAGKLIQSVFNVLKRTMKEGRRVGIITARDNKNLIYQFLFHHGIVVNPLYIFAINDPSLGFKGSVAEKKRQAFEEFLKMGFRDFVFYDDDKENIKIAEKLANDVHGIHIKTKLVKSNWK